ncbi:EamA family transporter [Streptomyces sp. NPDC047046]|uniref:EamA family transporter n=1 Tax=Streptomyces sp. NPDC047046 TaxID=3155378 RepID=UPI0033F55D1C
MLSNRRTGLLALTALAPLSWGSTYLVTTSLLPPGRPLLAATLRALPAGLVLLALARRLPRGDWWWRSLVLGVLNIGGFFALLFVAAYRLPGGVAATLGAVQPLFVAGLGARLLGVRVPVRVVLAGCAGLAGVALLVLRAQARLDALGVLAALGGALVMATGVVLGKRWTSPAPPLATTGWQLTWGGLLLVPLTLWGEGAPPVPSGENLLGYGYLTVVGTALAYALWFRGLRALPATEVSFLSLLSPLVATLLGLAAGESLTAVQAMGAVVVLGALGVAQGWGRGATAVRGLPRPAAEAPGRTAPGPTVRSGPRRRGPGRPASRRG